MEIFVAMFGAGIAWALLEEHGFIRSLWYALFWPAHLGAWVARKLWLR